MLLRVRHEMANGPRVQLARRGRAFAQTTAAARTVRQNGRIMRVQLEEHVSVAARMMHTLKGVAERGPVTRISEHA